MEQIILVRKENWENLKNLDHNKIQNALAQKENEWRFNPPAGSHYGKTWEHGKIHLIRKVLYPILRQQSLDDESFHNILCEIKAILNSRPITKLSDYCNDLEALTPNYILLLKTKPRFPTGLFEESDLYIKHRWKQVKYLSYVFWKKGGSRNISQCSRKGKNGQNHAGTTVLMTLLSSWTPLLSVVAGWRAKWQRKGTVCSDELRTNTGFLERPDTKLCMLMEACN